MQYNNVNPYVGVEVSSQNKVLKNTYLLLALSMIPTIIGTWVGVQLGIMQMMSPIVTLIVFLGIAFGFMYGIQKNKDSSVGVGLLLAFTFFMGIMLSGLISHFLGRSDGPKLIGLAFFGTALSLGGMSMLAMTIKRDLSWMNKFLFVGLIMLFVGGIANIFLQMPILMVILSAVSVLLFSLYILYDVKQIIDGGETNYVLATLSLYLNVYNIFQSLLQLLGIFSSDD